MIVFLEGINGTGKTAYAKALANRLGWPTYRTFRKGAGKHDSALIEQLADFGCPVNSHVDDIYLADFFATFRIDAILERSYPSALAYDTVYDTITRRQSAAAFKYWLKQLREFEHLYVWLEADYETAHARQSGFKPSKKEYKALVRAYDKAFHQLPKSKMRISTQIASIADGVEAICQRMKIC